MRREGFSLIEPLVALVVIGIRVALIVPAVQSSRDSARSMQCTSHLSQLGVAIGAYESLHGMFPPGGSNQASLHVLLLPHLDQQLLFEKYDFVRNNGRALKDVVLPIFLCPSDPAPAALAGTSGDSVACTSYAGN